MGEEHNISLNFVAGHTDSTPRQEIDENTSSSNSSASPQKKSDESFQLPSSDEDVQAQRINNSKNSLNATLESLEGIHEEQTAVANVKKKIDEYIQKHEIFVPSQYITDEFMESWTLTKKKQDKIKILSAVLPNFLIYYQKKGQIPDLIKYANELGSRHAGSRPNLMTKQHVEEALALREDNFFGLDSSSDEEDSGRPMRAITEAEIEYVLQFCYENSNESPETKGYNEKTKSIAERNLSLIKVLRKQNVIEKLCLEFEIVEGIERLKTVKRLTHCKFSTILDELNIKRAEMGQRSLTQWQFKRIIPGFFIEPCKKNGFGCVCPVCYNYDNLLSRGSCLKKMTFNNF